MLRPTIIALALFFVTACSRATEAETLQLTRLFTSPAVEQRWFSESFGDQAALAKIQTIIDQRRRQLGQFQRVEADRAGYNIHFSKGYVPVTIHLNIDGKIDGLFIKPSVVPIQRRG